MRFDNDEVLKPSSIGSGNGVCQQVVDLDEDEYDERQRFNNSDGGGGGGGGEEEEPELIALANNLQMREPELAKPDDDDDEDERDDQFDLDDDYDNDQAAMIASDMPAAHHHGKFISATRFAHDLSRQIEESQHPISSTMRVPPANSSSSQVSSKFSLHLTFSNRLTYYIIELLNGFIDFS